jgi:hypothetical protein
MHPTSQFLSKSLALAAALLLVGAAGAQEAKPAAPAAVPKIQKMLIYNGPIATINYSVQGGSPHLQALVQTLQFTENEINLTEELQTLRRGVVANEQILDRVRTSQALGFGPISTPLSAACYPPDSSLKSALIPGLAQEATPAMAYELINLREQVQTELQLEQARAAGLVRGDPPAGQNAPPAAPVAAPVPIPPPPARAPRPVPAPPVAPGMVPAPAVLPQVLMPFNPVAFQQPVRPNQDQARQQILQSLQQVFVTHQQVLQMGQR